MIGSAVIAGLIAGGASLMGASFQMCLFEDRHRRSGRANRA
jgi:hypothetical protein